MFSVCPKTAINFNFLRHLNISQPFTRYHTLLKQSAAAKDDCFSNTSGVNGLQNITTP